MRLFIAEKPSLARAIADALPGPQQRRDGYIQCGAGDVVAWCAGHVLELAAPDAYDPAFKQWRLEHLPVVPSDWKLVVTAPDLIKTIKALLPKASRVVHAGDPDREGQLLVDEVLVFLGYRGPVDRLLISDLSPLAVEKALSELQSNARFSGLYAAALARQRADWLYGINLTRLYTLLGRAGGYEGVLSVGRVQTPLLGLIVRRDLEIEQFQPHPYYVVRAKVRSAAGEFIATWRPSAESPRDAVDDERRLVSREAAITIQGRVSGANGTIARCTSAKKIEPPPLPYALPDLQIDAGKRLGLGPKQVLDACQALYETHRLLTYPRSDCSYLPEGQHDQATAVLAAVATNMPALVNAIGAADRSRRSRAWNDKKVAAHHAIIPTGVARSSESLTAAERGVYALVACRYLAQFYPASEVNETEIEVRVREDVFRATGRVPLAAGWRVLVDSRRDEANEADAADRQALPTVRVGEGVTCREVEVEERHTSPPKRFTEPALIQAMTGISRFVDDPTIKQLLRETDGIGTPATQAQIIETLFERRFIERQRGQVLSTHVGRALIEALPPLATRPDMTALWEGAIRRIGEGQMPLDAFLKAVTSQLGELVAGGRSLRALRMPPMPGSAGRGQPSKSSAPSKSGRRRAGGKYAVRTSKAGR